MEASRKGIKRWPGQLSNALEEVTQAECMRRVEELLDEAAKIKASLLDAGKEPRERAKRPARKGGPAPQAREAPAAPEIEVRPSAAGIGTAVRSWRDEIRQQPWFADARRVVAAILWDMLTFCGLYRLRDAVIENLGLGDVIRPEEERATGRAGKGETGRRGNADAERRDHKGEESSGRQRRGSTGRYGALGLIMP